MAYENSGTISKNKKKEKPNHPDITGQATIEGIAYWISGWKKTGQNGDFYSLAFKRKDGQGKTQMIDVPASVIDDDDSIPF